MDNLSQITLAWPVSNARGAPHRRPTKGLHRSGYNGAIVLVSIPLDDRGLDPGGAFWGSQEPLWGFYTPDMGTRGYVRSANEQEAWKAVRQMFPQAKRSVSNALASGTEIILHAGLIREELAREISSDFPTNTINDYLATLYLGWINRVGFTTHKKRSVRWRWKLVSYVVRKFGLLS